MTTEPDVYYVHPHDFIMRRRWKAPGPPRTPR